MQVTPAPKSPAAPGNPGTEIAIVQTAPVMPGVPRTTADVRTLKGMREELSNQLISASGRRQRLSQQLVGKDGVDRAGIESHIAVLDKRIMQLESDIAESGRLLSMTPGELVATAQAPQFFGADPAEILGPAITFIILVPLALAAARLMWKRATVKTAPQVISDDRRRQLERLEQSMDAIAVEVERISEGQRFVTRLLSEGQGSAALVRDANQDNQG